MASPPVFNKTIKDSNLIATGRNSKDGAFVIKQYLPKPLNTKMIKYVVLSWFGVEVPIEYLSASKRRDFELDCLDLWQKKGFRVPEVVPLHEEVDVKAPYIVLKRIDGERFDEYLGNAERSTLEKLKIIGSVFDEMNARHCDAIFEDEHRLIHYDANLRNVIIVGERPVHIDFEMGHLGESIVKSAAREVKKLSLQILNMFGREAVEAVVGLLVSRYQINHILRRMIDEELNRPFQSYHLKRDQQRKKKAPRLITKVDLALKLREKTGQKRSHPSSSSQDLDLIQAVETSWDGKYYQSLDDSDPRGRNMKHRYEVMKFPDSFENKTILDIGCNVGRICVDAKKRGASRAVGIDNRQDVVDVMARHFKEKGLDIELYTFDINDGVKALESVMGPTPFDYVCALSIWSHVDKQKLWDVINAYCKDVCFFEDNAPSRVKSLDRIEQILTQNLNFSQVDFLGFTTDRGVRAVFRLTR